MTQIAEGRAKLAEVLAYALDLFSEKFAFFRAHIDAMDHLMEASFSPLSATGAFLSRCGVCSRYMRYLAARPQRLYCQTCHATYALPQGGSVKTYFEFKCPFDGFELVVSHVDGGKSTVCCPYCYNNPPFEDFGAKAMSCSDCSHPTCRESLASNYVCDCTDAHCPGAMAFVVRSTGRWQISCNVCTTMLLLLPDGEPRQGAQRRLPRVRRAADAPDVPGGKSPLPTRAESVSACCFCDGVLAPAVREVQGRMGNARGGRGGRGGARGGRGGSGGRGRGGRDRRDPGR